MQISQDGVDLIKSLEGFRPDPYNDSAGFATIGYGTLIGKRPVCQADHDKWPDGISREDAEQLLRGHIQSAVEPVINTAVKVPLSQNQFDALCSFVYNLGSGAFKSSTLLKVINASQFDQVASQFRRWVNAGGHEIEGLKNRREREIAMWEGYVG